MPFTVSINTRKLYALGTRINVIADSINRENKKVIALTQADAHRIIVDETPVFKGVLSNSISISKVTTTGRGFIKAVKGDVHTQKPYGLIQERGRKAPGRFPPVQIMRRWVRLKVGRGEFDLSRIKGRNKSAKIKHAAFIVSRKIAQEGYVHRNGFQMFGKAEAPVNLIFQRRMRASVDRLVRRLQA